MAKLVTKGVDSPKRVDTVVDKGHFGYQLDGKKVPLEDGFSLAAGLDKPSGEIKVCGFGLPQKEWDRIFHKDLDCPQNKRPAGCTICKGA